MQFKRVGATKLWLQMQFHPEQIADQVDSVCSGKKDRLAEPYEQLSTQTDRVAQGAIHQLPSSMVYCVPTNASSFFLS